MPHLTVEDITAPFIAEAENLLKEVGRRDAEIEKLAGQVEKLSNQRVVIDINRVDQLQARLLKIRPTIKGVVTKSASVGMEDILQLFEDAVTVAEQSVYKVAAEGRLISNPSSHSTQPASKRPESVMTRGRWAPTAA